MIRIVNLKKRFGKLEVLKGINLHLEEGQVVAMAGPNGSGKTTLIKSILGLVIPDEGEIYIEGKEVKNNWEYRSHIGYMPQISRYPENLRIRELFALVKDLRSDCKILDEELYNTFRLEDIKDKSLGTLSGGTKQKVSAAMAFMFDPEILILDEPTAGLDPVSSEQLKDKILNERAKGKLIIITSHIMSDIEELADKTIFMMEGVVRLNESINDLKQRTGKRSFGKAVASIMEESYDY